MHTWLNLERHFINQDISIWRNNWNVFKRKIVSYGDLSFGSHINQLHALNCAFLTFNLISDLSSSKLAIIKVPEYLIQLVDQRCVASQSLDILNRQDNSTNSFSEVDQ